MVGKIRFSAALLGSASILAGAAQAADADADATANTIVVTGARYSNTARSEQKAALNLLDVQAAEDIVKYPDFNAAESLGRMPGVSLASDTGEGRFVNIRGIDGNLNGTTFGGVTLLNTQPGGTYFGGGGRAVELDTVPIGAVDRLVVRKTGMPDQDAEGLGGSVELTPRSASGIKHSFVDGTIGGGYQPEHQSWKVYRGEIAAGTRFGGPDQPFGIVAYGSYHEDHRGFDDVEAGYIDANPAVNDRAGKVFDSVDLRRYNYNRRRFGFGSELSYDPTPQSHYYLRATNAGYTESVNRQLLNYRNLGDSVIDDPTNPNGFIAPAASARLTLRDEQETHLNFITAAGGRNDLGSVIVDYQVAYTSATYHRDYDYGSRFVTPGTPFSVAYDNITDPNFPKLVPTGFNPNDPSQFTLSRLTNATERAHDKEWSGVLNVTVPISWFGTDETLKFGGKLRFRDKIDEPYQIGYSPPATPLTSLLGPGPFTDFYRNHYSVGYAPSAGAVRALAINGTTSLNAGGFFNDTENIYAGYAQYQGSFGNLGVLAGLRVEHTQGTYRGIVTTTDADGNDTLSDTSRKNNYTDFFPTVQLRYAIMPDLVARATWSTAIGRPGFLQLNSGAAVDVGALAVSIGNPALKPTTVNAFDAQVEYYLNDAGILSLGLFDKEFRNYVLARIQRNVDYPGVGPGTTVNSYSNVGGAYARGFEAQYVQKFAMLPAPFDGLGFTGNVTYVKSKIEIRDTPVTYSALPGTSEWTWNAGAFYEAHGAQLRLSVQHVGAAIFGVGSDDGLDVFQDKRTTLDLTTSYAITKNILVYFNAKNLTDEPLRYYEGSRNRPIQRELYGVSYEGGARFNF